MKNSLENEKILLEWFRLTSYIVESDKGNAKGNVVTAPSGTSGKSSSFSPATPQQSSIASNQQKDKQQDGGTNKNTQDKNGTDTVNKDGKSATKNYRTLTTDKANQTVKKLEKNKEITSSIEKLDKPKDIASTLQGVLQTTVNDGKTKEGDIKNAVKIFSRETLKTK